MKMQINPKYNELSDFIDAIPCLFSKYGKTVCEEQHSTVKLFKVNGLILNVKLFKKPSIFDRFIYRHTKKSKAERAFKYAQQGKQNIPEAVACIEIQLKGSLHESYYISIQETADNIEKSIHPDEKNENLIKAFPFFASNLYERAILHKDYSPSNTIL